MNVEQLLAPRIAKHCLPLYGDGHFWSAASTAMTLVESGLREKGQVNDHSCGRKLVKHLLSARKKGEREKEAECLKLLMQPNLQSDAQMLFDGAFAYYRNYLAHNVGEISECQCLRIMILASELLDMIDASSLTLPDRGGVEALVKAGVFESKEELLRLLTSFDGTQALGDDFGGLFEVIGTDNHEVRSLMDLDLMSYSDTECLDEDGLPGTVGYFTLTDLGKECIKEIMGKRG